MSRTKKVKTMVKMPMGGGISGLFGKSWNGGGGGNIKSGKNTRIYKNIKWKNNFLYPFLSRLPGRISSKED